MIALRWSRFPESKIYSYKVWRAIIGFEAPLINLAGKSLLLKFDGGVTQTFNFTSNGIVETINSTITGGRAFYSKNNSHFIVRSDTRKSPGSVSIVGGTAVVDLELSTTTITERSHPKLVGTREANEDPMISEEFYDDDGVIHDFYSISSISPEGVESLKTPWKHPTKNTGPLCVVKGIVCDLHGVRIPDAEIRATIQVLPNALRHSYISREPVVVISNPNGTFDLPLLQHAQVRIEIPIVGYSRVVTIPSQPYILLQDLQESEDYPFSPGF